MAYAVSFSYMEEIHMKTFTIRRAQFSDVQAILDIYQWYITSSTATFEYDVPSIIEFQERITKTLTNYPYLVCCKGSTIIGYCYASAHHERAAYQWNVELSIYIHPDHIKQGIGSALYKTIIAILTLQNIVNVYACITYPNPGSVQMHEAFGFHKIGHFTKTGFKFDRWLDVIWMEKRIADSTLPRPFISFSQLNQTLLDAIYQDVNQAFLCKI